MKHNIFFLTLTLTLFLPVFGNKQHLPVINQYVVEEISFMKRRVQMMELRPHEQSLLPFAFSYNNDVATILMLINYGPKGVFYEYILPHLEQSNNHAFSSVDTLRTAVTQIVNNDAYYSTYVTSAVKEASIEFCKHLKPRDSTTGHTLNQEKKNLTETSLITPEYLKQMMVNQKIENSSSQKIAPLIIIFCSLTLLTTAGILAAEPEYKKMLLDLFNNGRHIIVGQLPIVLNKLQEVKAFLLSKLQLHRQISVLALS
jgi:hypothetical protein